MKELRRKVCLPAFVLTEVCAESDVGVRQRSVSLRSPPERFTYPFRPVFDSAMGEGGQFNLFPVILNRQAAPWTLGTLYVLSRVIGHTYINMSTINGLADDLGAFKSWLDSHDESDEILFDFPKIKQRRPTYRYQAFLKKSVYAGDISLSTAKRRMSAVVAFYRWLIKENFLAPMYAPWQERTFLLSFYSNYGGKVEKSVASVDVQIAAIKSVDPLVNFVIDGGRLRPLSAVEQEWIMEALEFLGNGEMYLIILFMLLTGARVQTAATLRERHFSKEIVGFSKSLAGGGEVFKLKIGPGTGIDTKQDKNMVLHVPRALYELLHRYSKSERAMRRKKKLLGSTISNDYMFVTQQGNPYYAGKEQLLSFDPGCKRRHSKSGGTIRQFLKDHLIPYIRNNKDENFSFRLHDLRASYGLNQTDMHMKLVQNGTLTLHQARKNVMALMGHASSSTTDLYLNYRGNNKYVSMAIDGYGKQVESWIKTASGWDKEFD